MTPVGTGVNRMKSLRGIAVAIAMLMLAGLLSIAGAPGAEAQVDPNNTYHIPPRFLIPVGDAGNEPLCPGTGSVLYEVDADGGMLIRYCTLEATADNPGYVLVTTEAECADARAKGVQSGNDTLNDRGNWLAEVGLCWGGGTVDPDLTAESCQNSIFASVGPTKTCMIPIYKAAPADMVLPADVASLWGLEGTSATLQLRPEFIAQLDAGGWILITTNPVVYNGPVPADGILRFTIPAGFENAQYTVRAATSSGDQATFTFSFNDALPSGAVNNAVVPAAPPPELELALTDPYECGGGFTGQGGGGTPPYTISYRIDSAWYSADLGSFVSDTGQFETPDGYLDYSQIPEAWYSVSISIADSAQWTRTLSLNGFATEYITNNCGGSAATAVAVPAAQPADNEQPVGLAVTGATTDAALLVSQLLLGLGLSMIALLRLAHVRRRDDD